MTPQSSNTSSGSLGSAPVWQLEISSGPNRGAMVTLGPGCYRIGAADQNDIIFADAAVAPRHAELRVAEGRLGLVMFSPGGRLRQRDLVPGRAHALKAGSEITLGATTFVVHGPRRNDAARRHGAAAFAAICAVPFAAICAVPFAAICAAASAAVCLVFFCLAPTSPPWQPGAAIGQGPAASRAQAARALRAKLQDIGLAAAITATAADDAVVATGALTDADMPKWTRMETWFDARFGAAVPLLAHVARAEASLPPLNIAAVSMLPVPCIIARDGERFTQGAVLAGGWTVSHIDTTGITLLDRNGRAVRVTL